MSLYEYKCIECKKVTTVRVKYVDRPKFIQCKCKGLCMLIISNSNFRIKGFSEKNHYGLKEKKEET